MVIDFHNILETNERIKKILNKLVCTYLLVDVCLNHTPIASGLFAVHTVMVLTEGNRVEQKNIFICVIYLL